MSAAEILRMIETYDPDNAAGMDEIDDAAQAYVRKLSHDELFSRNDFAPIRYTRSRDALKQIRPAGCKASANAVSWKEEMGFEGEAFFMAQRIEEKEEFVSPYLPTEELAELHAIIQAIAHEREVAP